MFPNRLDDTQNRLLLLYAFYKIGKVTGIQMMRFLLDCEIMSYLDYILMLPLLLENGMLEEIHEDEERLYAITDSGIEAVNLFENRIPFSRRENVLQHAEDYRRQFQKEQSFQAEIVPSPDKDGFLVNGRILEAGEELFSYTLYAPTREIARTIVKNWRQ